MVGGFPLLPAELTSCPIPSLALLGGVSSLGRGWDGMGWVRTAAGWRGKEIEGEGKMLTCPPPSAPRPGGEPASLLRHSPETALSPP